MMRGDFGRGDGEKRLQNACKPQKRTQRDTHYLRLALRVAPPGLEPGLS